jgi:hypothetical protein
MQLNDMSKICVVVHVQEPVKKLCEALKFLAREDRNAVQTNEITIAAGATRAQRNTTLPLQRGGNAQVHAAKRDAQTQAFNQPQKQSNATLRSHTAAATRCGAATHTRQYKAQSQYCGAAPYSLQSRKRRECKHYASRV